MRVFTAVDAAKSRHLSLPRMVERNPVIRVLFVCTGNTCRSPLAATALRAELGEDAPFVEVSSAGIAATAGQPAREGSRRVAQADGLDLSAHRYRTVADAHWVAADFIFV